MAAPEDTMPDDVVQPDKGESQTANRRDFVKKLTYVTPVILTLKVNLAYAQAGSPCPPGTFRQFDGLPCVDLPSGPTGPIQI